MLVAIMHNIHFTDTWHDIHITHITHSMRNVLNLHIMHIVHQIRTMQYYARDAY